MRLAQFYSDVVLFIDEQKVTTGKLKVNDIIGSTEIDLIIGGVGDIVAPVNELETSEGFTGCISHLYFNFEYVCSLRSLW